MYRTIRAPHVYVLTVRTDNRETLLGLIPVTKGPGVDVPSLGATTIKRAQMVVTLVTGDKYDVIGASC
jgi:hypothetical protein